STTLSTMSSQWAIAAASLGTGPAVGTAGHSRRPVRQPAKMRTSSTWLATACGISKRLSSVREGRNGATIQWSPSAMIPSGAMCTAPDLSTVVTIVSRIIGMVSAALFSAERVPGLGEPRAIHLRPVGGDAPVERLILRIAFPEAEGGLGLHQLCAEVEGMRAIALHSEACEERQRIGRNVVAGAVVDVDAVGRRLDTEIVV